MIIQIYNWVKKKNKDRIYRIFGLTIGLIYGLTIGLIYGLAFGLVFGFANLPQLTSIPSWGWSILLIVGFTFVLGEIFYLIFTPKIKKINYNYVVKHKADNLFSALLIIVNILNIVWIVGNVDFTKYVPTILNVMGYIEWIVLITGVTLLLGWGYLKVNMEFKRKK